MRFEENAKEFLKQNKGSIPFHEWLVEQVDYDDMPGTLDELVALASDVVKGTKTIMTYTLGE